MRNSAVRIQVLGSAILLAAAVLAGIEARVGGPPTSQGPAAAVRVDPRQRLLQPAYDDTSAFEYFASIARSSDASGLLAMRRYASFQPAIRSLADQFTATLAELTGDADTVNRDLAGADVLVRSHRRAEAAVLLAQAGDRLRSAQTRLERSRTLVEDMSIRLRIGQHPAQDPVRRAYARLEQALAGLASRQRQDALVIRALRSGRPMSGARPAGVTVRFPGRAYLGRTITVGGVIGTPGTGGSPAGRVTIALDGRTLAQLDGRGSFAAEVALPSNVPAGWHWWSVRVAPGGGRPEAMAIGSIELARAPGWTHLRVNHVLWLPGRFVVSGDAASEFGPLAGAHVEAQLGDVVVGEGRLTPQGIFRLELAGPASVGYFGGEPLLVRVAPLEPWNAPVFADAQVFVVNLLRLGLTGAGALCLIGYLWTRRSQATPAGPSEIGPEPPERRARHAVRAEPPSGRSAARASLDAEAAQGGVLQAYLAAVHDIEAATGVRPAPSWTMREYQRVSAARRESPAFAQITVLAERALYSPFVEAGDILPAMRRLRGVMADELNHVGA